MIPFVFSVKRLWLSSFINKTEVERVKLLPVQCAYKPINSCNHKTVTNSLKHTELCVCLPRPPAGAETHGKTRITANPWRKWGSDSSPEVTTGLLGHHHGPLLSGDTCPITFGVARCKHPHTAVRSHRQGVRCADMGGWRQGAGKSDGQNLTSDKKHKYRSTYKCWMPNNHVVLHGVEQMLI